MKHPAPAEREVEVVEVEEELNNSRSNDVEVCTSDVNLNQDFAEQAADDPEEVDQCEVENQNNGSSGFCYEEQPASHADAINNGDHDEAADVLVELQGPAQESGRNAEMENGCSQCGKGFRTAGNLTVHIRSVHGPKKKCNVCQTLVSAANLKRHMKEMHEGDRRQCPECKKEIASSKFSQHMQIVHLGFKKKCPRCGKLVTSNGMSTHIKEDHDGVRKKCPHCPKQFKSAVLNVHIKEVHQGIRKKCPHCSKNFTSGALRRHIREDHDGVRKKCHIKQVHKGVVRKK